MKAYHFSFWQLRRLDYFTTNTIANFFVYERLKIPEAYSEPSRTPKMELFGKMVNSWKSLTVSPKSSILDVWLGSEYVYAPFIRGTSDIILEEKISQEKNWKNLGKNFCKLWVLLPKKVFSLISIKLLRFLFRTKAKLEVKARSIS